MAKKKKKELSNQLKNGLNVISMSMKLKKSFGMRLMNL